MLNASVLRVVIALQSVALAFGLGGCSLLVDSDRLQCKSDRDCTQRGPAFADAVCIDSWCTLEPRWSCLGTAQDSAVTSGAFPVTLHLQDIQTQQPLAGVQARLCRKSDVHCTEPAAEAVLSDALGVVRFAIDFEEPTQKFAGFVQLLRDDLVPALYVFNPPIEHAVDLAAVQLLSESGAEILARQIGASVEPQRGSLLLSAFDCNGEPAAGVMVSTDDADEQAAPFYSAAGLPVTDASATDTSGYAGLVNVSPGTIAVTGRLALNQRSLGTVSLPIQAGSITYSRMVPSDY